MRLAFCVSSWLWQLICQKEGRSNDLMMIHWTFSLISKMTLELIFPKVCFGFSYQICTSISHFLVLLPFIWVFIWRQLSFFKELISVVQFFPDVSIHPWLIFGPHLDFSWLDVVLKLFAWEVFPRTMLSHQDQKCQSNAMVLIQDQILNLACHQYFCNYEQLSVLEYFCVVWKKIEELQK